jgi:membrane protease YdiL (CAAX protease family)
VLFAVVAVLVLLAQGAMLRQIPAVAAAIERLQSGGLHPVWLTFASVGSALPLIVGLTALAARLEHRSLADHGLPLRSAFGSLFRRGALWGLVMATLVIAATWLLGGIAFAPPSLSVASIAFYAIVWAVSFAIVGISEELLFRGYALSALGQAIGFWPAAGLLAALFGALHLSNSGENLVGALNVVVYALFASLTLRRTGNLWFAIGIHTSWNYALSVLYGVPVSGTHAEGRILQGDLHGPSWLTGGTVGPEGSVLGFVVLALAFVVFAWRFPARPAAAVTPAPAAPLSTAARTDAAAIAT